ncbi:hypothetical protein OSB04_015611 [Centaurea solstitialis]|uniref:NB-ARC domain-containing protein n=1 Tax=Centaurea solstitialis TaxID=347529 RepID=A0AA38TCQ4_9ASTR|nr:hypothetical protein OSB04_015611 [Centaurea solstitialis]
MAYTGFQMFMDNLNHLININHHYPLINDNPLIQSKRPQFQLLYQEFGSIIQTLHQHHHQNFELEKVGSLKKRIKDAAEEAQHIIDLFVSAVYSRENKFSLDLDNVMRSINSIKVEFTTISFDNLKMDSSPRNDSLKSQSAGDVAGTSTSSTRSHLGTRKPLEEIVGLKLDAEIIRDKLAEDTMRLSIVSIVGMGGLGKTTLATKLFNDRFFKYHFHIRAWATVSQTYAKQDLLIQILVSIGVQQGLDGASDSQLHEKLHKKLMGRRYLIVIDDVWSIEAWNELKLFFPHENTGSRILLTTRLNEVALHVKPHGFVYSLPYLTEEESWELLKQKVFHGDECPEWLIESGSQIARKCRGLPLSLVVIAGVLAKEPISKDLWEEIACSVSSYIVSDQKGCLETLALSYHHLPDYLRECFLYLGGFPEDFRFVVERLIWLWVAEGFIEEAGNQSIEDTAKAHLMDLISRNLVIVVDRNVTGDVKACKVHDLVRELCLQKAKEERFFLKIDPPPSSSQLLEVMNPYKQRRVFTYQNIEDVDFAHPPIPSMRSLLFFHTNIYRNSVISKSFVLLLVLDLQNCTPVDIPFGLGSLVHLRYLAICYLDKFPQQVCKLWSLQTLILQQSSFGPIHLPHFIQNLVNLRHLWSSNVLCLPYIEKPMNLHSVSNVTLKGGVDNFPKCFPSIRKLALDFDKYDEHHFELLPYLETLKLTGPILRKNPVLFPATLKKLTLVGCSIPWSNMWIIQSLPNLVVLRLTGFAVMGTQWDACEQQFQQLKFLMLERLEIKQWKASTTSFPCLKQLSLSECDDLEEIPCEIGEIATLELIEIDSRSNSVVKSVKKIQQEQHEAGNYDLKITVDGKDPSFYLSQIESSMSEKVLAKFLSMFKNILWS